MFKQYVIVYTRLDVFSLKIIPTTIGIGSHSDGLEVSAGEVNE